jgi:hypothetical protein
MGPNQNQSQMLRKMKKNENHPSLYLSPVDLSTFYKLRSSERRSTNTESKHQLPVIMNNTGSIIGKIQCYQKLIRKL